MSEARWGTVRVWRSSLMKCFSGLGEAKKMCRRKRALSLGFVRSRVVCGVIFSVLDVACLLESRRAQRIGEAHGQQM